MSFQIALDKLFSPYTPPSQIPQAAAPRFEDELAGLAPDERQRRIESRQRYERFAQHQQLIEVETQADHTRNGP